jgi:hypothetical protein
MDIQPRGPVHEAFAQPWSAAPQPGPTIARKPPAPIPEVPPEQRPEGEGVLWIPGYWAWDAAREDFLWISGVWRVPPPGRKWVPGAWNAVEDGYQWTPGFWAPADQGELPFLSPPPDSLDNGPNSPPPDEGSFYVPGNWMYQGGQYAWQPGYWQTYRPDMMWMPSYYNWTPGGCLFVPGYWDWPLANRGLQFAPVLFNRPLWNTPGWYYQPNYVVPYSGLLSSLFLEPTGNGYYFGNYYGPSYYRLGFRPWFGGGWGNPLFSWYRWHYRGTAGWLNGLYSAYRGRYNGTLPRPPLTFNRQYILLNNTVNVQNNSFNSLRMVQPLNQLSGVRLARLNAAQLAEQRNLARNFQQLSLQRQGLQRAALRGEARRTLPLAHGVSRAPASALQPSHALASHTGASRVITTHHETSSPAAHPTPRVPATHTMPPAARLNSNVVPHHQPTAAVHHAAFAPAAHHAVSAVNHAMPATHHAAPATHHAAPAAHHAAPAPHHVAPAPAHHAAPPRHSTPANHGGGGHGGGHGGHRR